MILMHWLLLFSLLLVPLAGVFAQDEGPARLLVSGNITDIEARPVSYAHILVAGRNEGAVGDYYGTFELAVLPGDTLVISAVSFHRALVPIPAGFNKSEYQLQITLVPDTVSLLEVIIHPWPSTYDQFRQEFLETEVEDPLANLDLRLPSPQELKALSYAPGEPGQIRLYSGPGPVSLLYGLFSKEARLKKSHAKIFREEKAYERFNQEVVRKVTGMKNEDEIKKFIEFCTLEINFILGSTDYELYAAILECYRDFLNLPADTAAPVKEGF